MGFGLGYEVSNYLPTVGDLKINLTWRRPATMRYSAKIEH